MCHEYDSQAEKAAKSLLDEVRKLDRKPWEDSVLACQTIAEQLMMEESAESRAEAQKILEKATGSFSKDERSSKSGSLLVAIAFLDLGDVYWGAEEYDQAAKMHRESLKYDTTRYSRYLEALRRYDWYYTEHAQSQPRVHIINLLENLTKGPFKKLYLDRLVYDFIAEDGFRGYLLGAKEHEDWKEVVDKTFTQAKDVANGCHAELFHIQKVYGHILHECGDASREEEVVDNWTKALEYGKLLIAAGDNIRWPDLFTIINPLARIYLNRAEQALSRSKAGNARPTGSIENLNLIKGLEQKTDIWMNTTLFCCLARYYMASKNKERARKAVVKVIAASIAVLSDKDESNDWFAYLQLGKVFNALQDKENSERAWNRLDKLGKPHSDLLPAFPCAQCNEQVPLAKGGYICTECFGPKYFDEKCYDKCSEEQKGCIMMHKFAHIFPETQEPKNLTLNEKPDTERELKQWKTQLQKKYLGKDVGNTAHMPPTPPPVPTFPKPKLRSGIKSVRFVGPDPGGEWADRRQHPSIAGWLMRGRLTGDQ